MSNKVTVNFNNYDKVKEFNFKITQFGSEIDLIKGRFVIDAKSIMGVFALDLSEPIDVLIHSEDEEEIRRFNEVMEEFR